MNDRASTRDDTLATNASTTPLRAQLYHKLLTPEELAVLLAMLEIGDSTGQFLFPSVPRIADYAKLSERTVQKVLHGEIRKAPPKPPAVYIGLIERHILVQLAPANATKRRATTYRLQVEALRDDPRTERWRQKKLPFPADDVDLEKWIHHNPGAWSQIKRDLRNAAEARIGTQPLSSAASQAFMVSIMACPIDLPGFAWRLVVNEAACENLATGAPRAPPTRAPRATDRCAARTVPVRRAHPIQSL